MPPYQFNPYEDNGGVAVAVVAGDSVVIGADTRVSRGDSILSRNTTKICQLTEKCAVVSAGQRSEIDTLHKYLKTQLKQYYFEHKREASTEAVAQLLSVILYSRRFFPWYTFNIVAGITSKGEGKVYGFDAVGSTTPVAYTTAGAGMSPAQSLIDMYYDKGEIKDRESAEKVVLGALAVATEFNVTTGDTAEILTITKDAGVQRTQRTPLKYD